MNKFPSGIADGAGRIAQCGSSPLSPATVVNLGAEITDPCATPSFVGTPCEHFKERDGCIFFLRKKDGCI